MDNIDVVFAIDNNFVKQCAVTIISILKNTETKKQIRFHILTNFISAKNKKILYKLKSIKNFELLYYEINDEKIKNFPINRNWISMATYYRFLIPDVLFSDIEKCLYLDCDLICLGDIEDLWNYDIDNYLAGVVEDAATVGYNKRLGFPKENKYFNAGVLLLNLKNIRKISLLEKCREFYELKKDVLVDQDQGILNGVFYGQCFYLPIIWNICTPLYHRITAAYKKLTLQQNKDIYENPGIVHFTGIYKPWESFTKHPFKEKYWQYFSLSPYKLDYFIHVLKINFSCIYKMEKYVNGKKNKTVEVYLFGLKVYEFYKYKYLKKIKIFNIFAYSRLKTKTKKKRFLSIYKWNIRI